MHHIQFYLLHWLLIWLMGLRHAEANCRQYCDEPKYINCVKGATCAVTYDHAPPILRGRPRPLPSSLSLKPMCHQRRNGNITTHHVGIMLTWNIVGQRLGIESVEEFLVTIHDVSGISPVAEALIVITPNDTMSRNGNVTFAYYYDGRDEDRGPKIHENGKYMVALESVPIFSRGNLLPRKLRESIRIPKYFIEEKCENATDPTRPPPPNTETWHVLTTIFGAICLGVSIIALAAFSWKRRKDAHTALIASREHRVLVLLNVDDKAEVARQTNRTATALSRAKRMGDVTVKYNRWETNEILEKGIARWLDEKVSWANKIILSSTPDDLRNEKTAHVFEQAFGNVMRQRTSVDDDYKPIFIIFFDDKTNHHSCPYMNDPLYRKFHLEDDCGSLCRSIFGCIDSEQEPLHDGHAV